MEHLREEMEQIGLLRQVSSLAACLCVRILHKALSHSRGQRLPDPAFVPLFIPLSELLTSKSALGFPI